MLIANHRNRRGNSKKAGLVALIFAAILLVSCPPPTPDPAPTAPVAPDLTFTATDGTVMLSWTTVTGAVSYRIYRDSTDTPIETEPNIYTDTTYTDTDLTNGEDYTYTVQAVGSTGLVSPHSNPMTATPRLAAPDLTFIATDGTVTLSWNKITAAVIYRIYRNSTDTPLVTNPNPYTKTTYTDTDLDNGEDYTYTVRAVDSTGIESLHSKPVTATPLAAPTAPAAPDLMFTATDGTVMLSWTTVTGAESYRIYRAVADAATTPLETDPNPYTRTTYTDTGLDNGENYTYTVQAVDSAGLVSPHSKPVTATPVVTPPAAPSDLTATVSATGDMVMLSWTAVDDATYRIYRADADAKAMLLETVPNPYPRTDYPDSTVVRGTAYSYTVRALKDGLQSKDSNPATADPPTAAPENLTIEVGDKQLMLTWNEVTGATRYNVYRVGAATSPLATIRSRSSRIHIDADLDNGTEYTYTVRSMGNNGVESADSDPPTAATPTNPPVAPDGLRATSSATGVMLTWNEVTGATRYNVYRSDANGRNTVLVGTDIAELNHTDSTIVGGSTYKYTVRALNGRLLLSEPGDPALANPPTLPPEVLTAVAEGNRRVVLTWTTVPGAVSYSIYRRGVDMPFATVNHPTLTHTDMNLVPDTTYYYTVRSAGSNGAPSDASDEESAIPRLVQLPVPGGFSFLTGDTDVLLSWNAVADADAYRVSRTVAGVSETVATVNNTSYTVERLTPDTAYNFFVQAVQTVGTAEYRGRSTESLSATPGAPVAPRRIRIISAVPGGDQIRFAWDAVPGVTSYNIYRDGSATPLVTDPITYTATTYTDTGLNPVVYSYIVRAVNRNGTVGAESRSLSFNLMVPTLTDLSGAGNDAPRGMWANDTTMWVADNDGTLYAYTLETERYDESMDINLVLDTVGEFEEISIRDIWSDGATIWAGTNVIDEDGGNLGRSISAYALDGTRERANDFSEESLGADITRITALWSNKNLPGIADADATMWVLDSGTDKIYAYNMMTKERDSAKDITLYRGDPADMADNGNVNPFGLWSNGETIWVSDWQDDKFYAYNLDSGAYTPGNNFETLATGHNFSSYLWSDGTTLWGLDFSGKRLYEYNLNTRSPITE